jgi:exonuclease III
LKLVSWNVAGRVTNIREQAEALASRGPDIVALQEITATTAELWPVLLRTLGLLHVSTSLDFSASAASLSPAPKRAGVLLASRWPLSVLPPAHFRVPWPQCIASAVLRHPFGSCEVHTIHVPPATVVGWLNKVATLDGVFERLARDTELPRILCGDFNSPKEEYADGRIIPFGSMRTPQPESELRILKDLERFDLFDVYRQLHGYSATDSSWYWSGHGRKIGRRFDHVFASRSLNATSCHYMHTFREDRLSDHSAIEVTFSLFGH